MGDLNCNLLSEVVSNNSCHLLNIIDIYGLTLLITKPTRVTQYSSTMIDLCLTNFPDKISKSGVINIGISDSSRISMKLNFLKVDFWKHLLASVIDKHAPFRTKRVKNKRSPWITNELLREIHKRDFLKKKAASTNDPSIWKQFKDARNKANNSVKKAKRKYFSENLDANKSDPRKTWRLINELQSRQSKSIIIIIIFIYNIIIL